MINLILSSKKTVLSDPSLIYFFGDSITFGVGASNRNNKYSTLTAAGASLAEINDGLSQSPLQASAYEVPAGVDRYSAINGFDKHEFVVILYGINDCIRVDSYGMTINNYIQDMSTILNSIKNFKIPRNIIVCTLTPNANLSVNGIALRNDINNYILGLQSSEGVSVVDVAIYLENNGGTNNFPDGTHPDDIGHQLIADIITSKINSLI